VNDAIYVFGGNSLPTDKTLPDISIGEKFALRENKWRDVISRSGDSHSAQKAMK
jgi:hypothetical protein